MLISKKRFKAQSLEDMVKPGFLDKIKVMPNGCWEWQGPIGSNKYGKMSFLGGTWNSHRVAWMIFKGTIPDGMFLLHKCDNPPCSNPDHLFLGTHRQNMRDMTDKGRKAVTLPPVPLGEKHYKAKLTNEQVKFIRASSLKSVELAKQFGVTASCVGYARRGQSYKVVE